MAEKQPIGIDTIFARVRAARAETESIEKAQEQVPQLRDSIKGFLSKYVGLPQEIEVKKIFGVRVDLDLDTTYGEAYQVFTPDHHTQLLVPTVINCSMQNQAKDDIVDIHIASSEYLIKLTSEEASRKFPTNGDLSRLRGRLQVDVLGLPDKLVVGRRKAFIQKKATPEGKREANMDDLNFYNNLLGVIKSHGTINVLQGNKHPLVKPL